MKLSFVIPTHNAATWLPHATSSVLQQTYKDIEIVIVDDGSTDRTVEYLDFIKRDERVKVIRTGKNIGRSAARNLGNSEASGEIICVLDADDIATPNRAELTVKKFKTGKVDFVYGSATVIDALGRPLHILGADTIDMSRVMDESKNPHLQNRIVHSTVAYTKKLAEQIKYRDGEISKLGIDDWASQIEAMTQGYQFDFIPHRLACYRQLSSQITRTRDEEAVMKAKREFLASLRVAA